MQIDFYILSAPNKQRAWLFACQLMEKMYPQEAIHVLVDSREEATRLDDLLWTYKDDSFLPHAIDDTTAPITISEQTLTVSQPAVLINLSQAMPQTHANYQRVIEIVYNEPTIQQLARERYKVYRDAGGNLAAHKLNI